jgi:hypothetical protein
MNLLNKDYAIYLPAVNNTFAAATVKPLPANRPFPQDLELSDLIFWNRDNKLWHYSHILHSVGLYKVGKNIDNTITRAGKTDCFLLGDSGGFQIGSGTLKGYKHLFANMNANTAVAAWQEAYAVKKWIVDLLELHADYAMTIDIPLWATLEQWKASSFHKCSIQQLIELTVENLHFIDVRRQNRTKWLNVIQGLDEQTTLAWWNAVKWFNCSGYALAGAAGIAGGIANLLRTVLTMRDDGAFEDGHDWIHVLGVSTSKWTILLSAIQRGLRNTANPKLQISYDSATPFSNTGERDVIALLPKYSSSPKDWVIRFIEAPQSAKLTGSNEPFPYLSPIGSKLTLGDLNVRGGDWEERSFDTVSTLILCNHNCWVFLEAFRQANELAFATNRSSVPAQWSNCIDFIENIFSQTDWRSELARETIMLDEIAPSDY